MTDGFIRVGDVMQTNLHKISGLASVKDAIELMRQQEVSSLLIERRHDGDECGLITVRDIASKVVAVNKSTERTNVYEVMNKPAVTVPADMNVKYAIRLLAQLGLSRALVLGATGPVGLVTMRDMVLGYAKEESTGD